LWLAVLAFVAVSLWWLTQDDRIPIWDPGYHMLIAYNDSQALAHGHPLAPFTAYYAGYPPVLHLVGAVSIFLVGMHPMSLVMTANFVFVPLLAFGCYGVGNLVAGSRAGLLAGLFALATPMFVSEMHDFFIDTAQAAMVAVGLWSLLAARRFERVGVAALAGALCGLALITKETSAVFLVGAGLALLVRGGWRNWTGLLAFTGAVAVIAGPWYVYHWHDIINSYTQIGEEYVSPVQSPPRWSLSSLGWYFWNLVNEQVLVPFTLLVLIGTVLAVRRCVRDRFSTSSVLPEVLAGGAVSYLGMTYLAHKDPRYTLPALVYIAVLSTYWIAQVRRTRVRQALTGAFVTVAVINFVGMSTGLGGTRRLMVALPGAPFDPANSVDPYSWHLTLYENQGWLRGGPQHDGDVRWLLSGLRQMGVTRIAFDGGANEPDFSLEGTTPLALELKMGIDPPNPTQAPNSAFLFLHVPRLGELPPCQFLNDGMGVYAIRGHFLGFNPLLLDNPQAPRQQYQFVCPGSPPVMWPRPG
jgi:4-amino-4-deoxy-L-arabinose transferase-like glycosyltransferase